MNAPAVKFRPSLSAAQISHILSILELHGTADSIHASCVRALRVFDLKAKHGIVTPSHVTAPKPSIEQALGFSDTQDDSINILLDVYNTNPSVLSESQLAKVQLHRYTNDLMDAEEEMLYETGAIGAR